MPILYMIAGLGIFVGLYGVFHALLGFRRKQLIDNLPTSTARSLAMGLVEIVGAVRPIGALITPFSQKPCAYYNCSVEQWVHRTSDSGFWKTMCQPISERLPFHVEDETGQALVMPEGAQIRLSVTYEKIICEGEPIPPDVIPYMRSGVSREAGKHPQIRLQERAMTEGLNLFVMGFWQTRHRPLHSKVEAAVLQDEHAFVGSSQTRDEVFYISSNGRSELSAKWNRSIIFDSVVGMLALLPSLALLCHCLRP